ncbi:MAG: universal stress protein [Cellvibrionaceae bacterium]
MFNNEKLLVIVDPTQIEPVAAQRALANAKIREDKAEIHIMFIVDVNATNTSAENVNNFRDSQWFADTRAPLLEEGLTVISQVCFSTEYQKAILNYANQRNIDMIMLPIAEDQEAQKRSFSNDRWAILRQSECPVLLVKPGKEEQRSAILASIKIQNADEKQEALNNRVLSRARWSAERYGAELHVVNAYKDSMDYPDRGLLAKMADIPSERIHVEQGVPEDIIAQVADSINADVVALGTNRREGLGELLRGNTSEKVIMSIRQDVLTVN